MPRPPGAPNWYATRPRPSVAMLAATDHCGSCDCCCPGPPGECAVGSLTAVCLTPMCCEQSCERVERSELKATVFAAAPPKAEAAGQVGGGGGASWQTSAGVLYVTTACQFTFGAAAMPRTKFLLASLA